MTRVSAFIAAAIALGACHSRPQSAPQVQPPAASAMQPVNMAGARTRTCRASCAADADCAVPGQPMGDAKHFACVSGTCEWRGCMSAEDCATMPGATGKYTCDHIAGTIVGQCLTTCATPADCAVPGQAIADQNHFACNAGRCQWTGCKGPADCPAKPNGPKLACERVEGAPFPSCVATCATAADCAAPGSPLSDEHHFACQSGRCQWLGCVNNAECATALRSPKYVCQ